MSSKGDAEEHGERVFILLSVFRIVCSRWGGDECEEEMEMMLSIDVYMTAEESLLLLLLLPVLVLLFVA